MKIEEYAPAAMPTNSASARSLSAPEPSDDHADVEQRADRQQRHDRGVDRPDQGLVDRQVRGLGVGLPGAREVLGVLADLVEDDDRVVEREAEDGQDAGHGRRRDLEAGQRVDADRDHQVVGQRDDRADGHLPLAEVRPDEQHHQDQEDTETEQRPVGDLGTPGRADGVPADRRCCRPRRPPGSPAETCVAWSLSSGSVWTRMLFGPDVLTIGDRGRVDVVVLRRLGDRVADLLDVGLVGLAGRHRDAVLDAALELDAEVEALADQPVDARAAR